MSDAPASLAAALAALQADLPAIAKSETANVQTKQGSYSYSYAGLAQISAVILPRLAQVGLSFTARPGFVGERYVLICTLMHTSGEREEGHYPLPTSGTPQGIGSAITYGRRYVLCSMTGIAPEDDDDGAAAEAERQSQQGTARRSAPPRQRQNQQQGQQAQRSRPAPQAPTEAPPLPGEESATPMITEPQQRKLGALMRQRGITERDAALAYVASTIGRQVASRAELTSAEAGQVITALEQGAPAAAYDDVADAEQPD